jgi:hypothetical protein
MVSLEFFSDIILPVALWPQPLTEMSTRCISWGKGGRCVRLTTLPSSCAVVMKSGNLNFPEPFGPLQACNGTAFLWKPKIPYLFHISLLDTIPCQFKVVHILTHTHISYFCKFIIMKSSHLHLGLCLSSVIFASSFELHFVPLCHFSPCKLPMYTRNNNLHWLT